MCFAGALALTTLDAFVRAAQGKLSWSVVGADAVTLALATGTYVYADPFGERLNATAQGNRHNAYVGSVYQWIWNVSIGLIIGGVNNQVRRDLGIS